MDVISQAASVVEEAEAIHGRVTLTLDLEEPAQRAAYAAALAVLQINGIDPLTLAEVGSATATDLPAAPAPHRARAGRRAAHSATDQPSADAGSSVDASEAAIPQFDTGETDAAIRRSYADALDELTPDTSRAKQIVQETFPRVRELLRDGANVEAVAQIQYRRWNEEHLDTSRN